MDELQIVCREGLAGVCRRERTRFTPEQSILQLLPVLGLVESQVDLALLDGRPLGLTASLGKGQVLQLYPPLPAVSPESAAQGPCFVADAHLGRLAAYLRMLGFDTCYRNDYGDDYLYSLAKEEQRVLLSRDRELLRRVGTEHGYAVRALQPREQLLELIAAFELCRFVRPFSRCLGCNGLLNPVEREDVIAELPARTPEFFDHFWRCCGCGRLYWKGAHYPRMRRLVRSVLVEACGM